MKRFLCPEHLHYLKTEGKSLQLSTLNCSICRFKKRLATLADLARDFEGVALDLRFAHENPSYDPHGISFSRNIETTINRYLKAIHPDYRTNFLKAIQKDL